VYDPVSSLSKRPLKTEEERRKEKAGDGQPNLPDMSFMTEREKRTILRKLSKGEDVSSCISGDGEEKSSDDEDSEEDQDSVESEQEE